MKYTHLSRCIARGWVLVPLLTIATIAALSPIHQMCFSDIPQIEHEMTIGSNSFTEICTRQDSHKRPSHLFPKILMHQWSTWHLWGVNITLGWGLDADESDTTSPWCCESQAFIWRLSLLWDWCHRGFQEDPFPQSCQEIDIMAYMYVARIGNMHATPYSTRQQKAADVCYTRNQWWTPEIIKRHQLQFSSFCDRIFDHLHVSLFTLM